MNNPRELLTAADIASMDQERSVHAIQYQQ